MVQLSEVQEDELFKICLDFWHFFSLNIMDKTKGTQFYNKCKLTILVNSCIEQTDYGGMNFAGLLDNSFLHT
jgi:hypothetical protein